MAQVPGTDLADSSKTPPADALSSCVQNTLALEELLGRLEDASGGFARTSCVVSPLTDQRLVERRLGDAAGLFVALRCKDAATATHCLRVALLCSVWARNLKLPDAERDQIEVASLLHDLGIVGVPDGILNKPAPLEGREVGMMAHARRLSHEILCASGAAARVAAIVENIPVWYNTPAQNGRVAGTDTPRGARMIAIVEAFDSMITDHVYRPARAKEQAITELVRCAGTQFDPVLVDQFAEIGEQDLSQFYRQAAGPWLESSSHGSAKAFGDGGSPSRELRQARLTARFQDKILDSIRESVITVDPAMNIIGWNRATEHLTQVLVDSVIERPWSPEIVEMRDDQGRMVFANRCPLRRAIATGMRSDGRFGVSRRNGDRVVVETTVLPVFDEDSSLRGAVMIMHDISSERSLRKLCENLQSKAAVDPLTHVSNRAEFDRVHEELAAKYAKSGSVYSVVICDLDHFKRVNDTYGHQAGDEVLKKTAASLQEASRPNDLVARYGGEEFAILCPDLGIAAATRLAEQVRNQLGRVEHASLAGIRATASFGVTQVQPGDTAETTLRRADRALYQAKDQGRNRVIQLGMGTEEEKPVRRWGLWRREKRSSPEILAEEDVIAPGPIRFALDKLRGFVADHQAVIKRAEENMLEFEMIVPVYKARRKADLRQTLTMRLKFWEEMPAGASHNVSNEVAEIRINVVVSQDTPAVRGGNDLTDYARQVIRGLRAYLMAKMGTRLEDRNRVEGRKILLPPWPAS